MVFIVLFAFCSLCLLGAVPDFTCYNGRLYATEGNLHTIGGFNSGSDYGAAVSFKRVLNTGSGSNLPTGGYEQVHTTVSAILYRMPAYIGADRFGAYNCIFGSQDPVKITTIILRKNGKERNLVLNNKWVMIFIITSRLLEEFRLLLTQQTDPRICGVYFSKLHYWHD